MSCGVCLLLCHRLLTQLDLTTTCRSNRLYFLDTFLTICQFRPSRDGRNKMNHVQNEWEILQNLLILIKICFNIWKTQFYKLLIYMKAYLSIFCQIQTIFFLSAIGCTVFALGHTHFLRFEQKRARPPSFK